MAEKPKVSQVCGQKFLGSRTGQGEHCNSNKKIYLLSQRCCRLDLDPVVFYSTAKIEQFIYHCLWAAKQSYIRLCSPSLKNSFFIHYFFFFFYSFQSISFDNRRTLTSVASFFVRSEIYSNCLRDSAVQTDWKILEGPLRMLEWKRIEDLKWMASLKECRPSVDNRNFRHSSNPLSQCQIFLL